MSKYKKVKSNVAYHLGNHILKKLEEREISKSELGRLINVQRQNINDIVKRESMDTELLSRISKALNYDFFKDLSSEFKKEL